VTDAARPENTMDWRNDAACKDEDPDVFFPIGTTGIAVDQVEDAKRICARCPVQEPCLEFALASNQDAGVWGGLTEDERRTLKRARQRRRRLVS
jgi:WhiB family redox-sensing transcriptional regulator